MGVTIITIKWSSSTAQDLIPYLRPATEEPGAVSSDSAVKANAEPEPVAPAVVASVVIASVVVASVVATTAVVSKSFVKADDPANVFGTIGEEEDGKEECQGVHLGKFIGVDSPECRTW